MTAQTVARNGLSENWMRVLEFQAVLARFEFGNEYSGESCVLVLKSKANVCGLINGSLQLELGMKEPR